ncbi:MAG: hydrogenase expression/formation protein [Armatimonadetes bacterium]|nr:hydrogenase expression/formation protein [Armatimonadota bacterium]
MEIGKLPHELLDRLISRAKLDARVIVGPMVGEDAAVIDFGPTLLVAKTDPITFATERIGWYSVNINANDIAVTGADPKWFLATVLLPECAKEEIAVEIMDQILSACDELGMSLVGGHTEITYKLDRPIVVGCALGEVKKGDLITTGGAKIGDAVILTGGIAIEGTALLAREAAEHLLSQGVAEETIEISRNYLTEPGISIVRAAAFARRSGRVNSMHDPTEGGLATGLFEVAVAADVGLEIDFERIPVLPETEEICRALKLDPLGLIASGSLLLTVDPADAGRVAASLTAEGIVASAIGAVVDKENGLKLIIAGKRTDLPKFPRDEVARFFSERG